MTEESRPASDRLQPTQLETERGLLRDEDLLNEEHLQFVHLYTPEANELRRRIGKYMLMERMIEREMARRHTY